jgi:hypothetical protein
VINVHIVLKLLMMLEVLKFLLFLRIKLISFTEDRYHRLCQFDDEQDQCRFFYTYHTEKDQLILRVQKTKSIVFVLLQLFD